MVSHVCKRCGTAWNAPKVAEPSPPAGVWAQNAAVGGLLPALSPGLQCRGSQGGGNGKGVHKGG
eukprot:8189303-Pyramimonas_sp.AAC.1